MWEKSAIVFPTRTQNSQSEGKIVLSAQTVKP
jgi:hypothetical protein